MQRCYTFARIGAAVLACAATLAACSTARAASQPPGAARFDVGFAKENITPSHLPFRYLGGDGYQRIATRVLNDLWVRALAIAPAGGNGRPTAPPFVLVVIDSQGYFSGYQALPGPGGAQVAQDGLVAMRNQAAAATHLPVANVVFSSTHSHTAPDTIGAWGGAPASYFTLVRDAGVRAVESAVEHLHQAWLRRGDASAASLMYNPTPRTSASIGHSSIWPVYGRLTVIQALSWGSDRPLLTLFDVGVHPDIMENTPYISPDWPAWTIASLSKRYGGHSMFLQGSLGSEPVLPTSSTANAVERHEAAQPPYLNAAQDIVGTWVGAVRIGDGLLFELPGEMYADVVASVAAQVRSGWYLPDGLANDQLGYVVMPAEWPVVVAENGQGEPNVTFGMGPNIGRAVVLGVLHAAREVGFAVHPVARDLVQTVDDPVASQMAQCKALHVCR